MGKLTRIGVLAFDGTSDAIIIALPAVVCYRGRTYNLTETARHGLILTVGENVLTGAALPLDNP